MNKKIIISFEKAEELAFRSCFLKLLFYGCYFYVRQAVWCKVQSLRIATRYESDINYSMDIEKFVII